MQRNYSIVVIMLSLCLYKHNDIFKFSIKLINKLGMNTFGDLFKYIVDHFLFFWQRYTKKICLNMMNMTNLSSKQLVNVCKTQNLRQATKHR